MATTNTARRSFDPHIADYPHLLEWLDARSARHLWTAKSDGISPCVQGWSVGGAVVLVTLYAPTHAESGEPHGWGIAVEPNTIDISKTFAEIDRQIKAEIR